MFALLALEIKRAQPATPRWVTLSAEFPRETPRNGGQFLLPPHTLRGTEDQRRAEDSKNPHCLLVCTKAQDAYGCR